MIAATTRPAVMRVAQTNYPELPAKRVGRSWVQTRGVLAEGFMLVNIEFLRKLFVDIEWSPGGHGRLTNAVGFGYPVKCKGCIDTAHHAWPDLHDEGGTAMFFPLREQVRQNEGYGWGAERAYDIFKVRTAWSAHICLSLADAYRNTYPPPPHTHR